MVEYWVFPCLLVAADESILNSSRRMCVWRLRSLMRGAYTAGVSNDETNSLIKLYFYKHQRKTMGI